MRNVCTAQAIPIRLLPLKAKNLCIVRGPQGPHGRPNAAYPVVPRGALLPPPLKAQLKTDEAEDGGPVAAASAAAARPATARPATATAAKDVHTAPAPAAAGIAAAAAWRPSGTPRCTRRCALEQFKVACYIVYLAGRRCRTTWTAEITTTPPAGVPTKAYPLACPRYHLPLLLLRWLSFC